MALTDEQPRGMGYVPNHAVTSNYNAAMEHMRLSRFESALDLLLKEPADSPCRGIALAHAALAQYQIGEYDKAIRDGHAAMAHFAEHDCPVTPIGVMASRTIADGYVATDRVLQSLEIFRQTLVAVDQLVVEESRVGPPNAVEKLELEKAHTLAHYGGALLRLLQPAAALVPLQAAREIYKKYPNQPNGRPEALRSLAQAYRYDAKNYEATAALGEALSVPGLNPDQELEIKLLQVRLGLLDSAQAEQVIAEAVDKAVSQSRYEAAYARLASVIAGAADRGDYPLMLKLSERISALEPRLPSGSLMPVKMSFYHALMKRDAGRPPEDYFHHLIEGARDWCSLPLARWTLADYQQLASTMHDHFRLLARVLFEQERWPESFIAFEMGRARGYASELRQNGSHALLATNPFKEREVELDLLLELRQKLAPDSVFVSLGTMPPDLICYVIGTDGVNARAVRIQPDILESLTTLPKKLESNQGLAAVHPMVIELAEKIRDLVGERKILGFTPHRVFHLVPWRAVLHSVGLAWGQLPFAITFSPLLWQPLAAVPLRCISLGFGTAGGGTIDLAKEAEDFAAIFGKGGRQYPGTKARLEDALASDGIVLVSCHGTLVQGAFGPQVFFQLEDGPFELNEAYASGRGPRSAWLMITLSVVISD